MSSSVAIASFAGAKTNPFDSDASTDSTGVAPTISRARSKEPCPRPVTIARYPRACRSPSRCATSVGLPCADPQDRSWRSSPSVNSDSWSCTRPATASPSSRSARAAGQAERVGERLRFLVRPGGAAQRSARLREDDPRPVGQELGGCREPVEEERRRGLHPLGMQTVRDPLQEVGEPVGLANRLGCGSCPDVAVRDQLLDRADLLMGQSRGRELRRRGELAERLDLVAPVLRRTGRRATPGKTISSRSVSSPRGRSSRPRVWPMRRWARSGS